jgi:hypothetical protein
MHVFRNPSPFNDFERLACFAIRLEQIGILRSELSHPVECVQLVSARSNSAELEMARGVRQLG